MKDKDRLYFELKFKVVSEALINLGESLREINLAVCIIHEQILRLEMKQREDK